MKERPILFSGPMVRAILNGRKTQTRRVCKLNAAGRVQLRGRNWHIYDPASINACPYGLPGDRLWVRETFQPARGGYRYRADHPGLTTLRPWKPSIFMPRAASRITLEIVKVRIERLVDISENDAMAEGWSLGPLGYSDAVELRGWPLEPETIDTAREWYQKLWDSINGDKHPWASNPWVWVVEFKNVTP